MQSMAYDSNSSAQAFKLPWAQGANGIPARGTGRNPSPEDARSELEELCNAIVNGVFERISLWQAYAAEDAALHEAPLAESADGFYLKLTAALKQAALQADAAYGRGKDRNRLKAEEVMVYIDEHYEEDFGLEQVTDSMGCSSTYLNRLLKQFTGSTFYQLLSLKRIDQAKLLLTADLRTVGEIGLAVGYTNVHSFIRAFKRSVGVTPGQYRESGLSE